MSSVTVKVKLPKEMFEKLKKIGSKDSVYSVDDILFSLAVQLTQQKISLVDSENQTYRNYNGVYITLFH